MTTHGHDRQDAVGIAFQLVVLVLGVGLLVVGRRAREPGTRASAAGLLPRHRPLLSRRAVATAAGFDVVEIGQPHGWVRHLLAGPQGAPAS